jgi:hypothetical protein
MEHRGRATNKPCLIYESTDDIVIEQVDSDEEAAKSEQIRSKRLRRGLETVDRIRQCIVDYLLHISEDVGFFPDGIRDVAGAFEQWSREHCRMTECHSNWSRTRSIFVGSSNAHDLFRKSSTVFKACAPYNLAAGLQRELKDDNGAASGSPAVRMGIAMEDVVRDSHVSVFSKPLKTAKPGRVVSTRGPVGMSCTGDIELLDEHMEVVGLLEVKTMYGARVSPGLCIPDTAKKARLIVRDTLATHGAFSLLTTPGSNIFRQSSRFVDLKMLDRYGYSHAEAKRRSFEVHSHVQTDLFLECCMPRKGRPVRLYFYEAGETSGEAAQAFSMEMSELGLTVNPWCATTCQMLIQQCVYRTCCSKTISKKWGDHRNTWMGLLLVVPYRTDKAEPYLIMEMPVHFSDRLCEQVENFYATAVGKYVDHSTTR